MKVLAFLTILLSFLCVLGAWHELRRWHLETEAQEELHKLATASLRIFQDHFEPEAKIFWRRFGRTQAMEDPWGTPYQMSAERYLVRWKSAGPDRRFGTSDDLELSVPVATEIPENPQNKSGSGTMTQDAVPAK